MKNKTYFSQVSNDLFLPGSGLHRKARQILLILEVRAGTSRVAHLSRKEIAEQTSYSLRTVDHWLARLRNQGWIERIDEGKIQLVKPVPITNFIQIYEGVVHRPEWHDWQIQILLFIMAQYCSAGYVLNLFGKIGDSIEKYCSIPGKPKDRRRKIRAFVDQLIESGIVQIIRPHCSKRPAICDIRTDLLAEMVPDCSPKSFCYVSPGKIQNSDQLRTKRSKPASGNVADIQTKRSKPASGNVADLQDETYFKKKPKETEATLKNPKPPGSTFSGGGTTSSCNQERLPGSSSQHGHSVSELNDESREPEFARFLKNEKYRELANQIHHECSGFSLQPSKAAPRKIAAHWTALMEELPDTVIADHVVEAIRSQEFESLNSLSWGLLLSDDMIGRFGKQIRKYHDQRRRIQEDSERAFSIAHENLSHSDPAVRLSAIGRLMAYPDKRMLYSKLIKMIAGDALDDSDDVRLQATRNLYIIAMDGELSGKRMNLLRRYMEVALKDSSPEVRDEAGFVLEQLWDYESEDSLARVSEGRHGLIVARPASPTGANQPCHSC